MVVICRSKQLSKVEGYLELLQSMTTPGSNSPVLRSRNGTENPPDRFDEKIFCRTSQILLID